MPMFTVTAEQTETATPRELVTPGVPDEPYPIPDVKTFIDEEGRLIDFITAPDLEEIASALIASTARLFAARDLRIRCLWKREGGQAAGVRTLGKCVKASGLVKHYADCDFVVWLAADWLRAERYACYQVEACVYHELLHISFDENGKAGVRGHDAELFLAEFYRYGLWDRRLESVADATRQLRLDGIGES